MGQVGSVSVAFIDDHPVLVEGIRAVFASKNCYAVVGHGSTAGDAIAVFNDCHPDLMFLDLSMDGDVIAAIKYIVSQSGVTGTTKIIVYTASTDVGQAIKILDCGVRGYVVKDSSTAELFGAVSSVLRGDVFISPNFAGRVFNEIRLQKTRLSAMQAIHLSVREMEVVHNLMHAYSNKEIAIKMEISEKTVKHYMTNLMSKLNVRNRVEAALAARQYFAEAGQENTV